MSLQKKAAIQTPASLVSVATACSRLGFCLLAAGPPITAPGPLFSSSPQHRVEIAGRHGGIVANL